jgi:hypothetical protein
MPSKTQHKGKERIGVTNPKKRDYRSLSADHIAELGRDLVTWMQEDESRLWLKGFCIEEKIPSPYLSKYASVNEDFADSLQMAKDIQEMRLFYAGNTWKNPAMLIMGLKNASGWRSEPQPDEGKGADSIEFS